MQDPKSNAPVTFLRIAVAVAVAGAAEFARGQEIELPPIVVTGTFELRPAPSVTDLFTLHLQKQFETKRAVEGAVAKSPWYYSRFGIISRCESKLRLSLPISFSNRSI